MELIIKKIKILDLKNRKYGEYRFSNKITLITGENKAGKSSLIKTIIHSFGFEVKNWASEYDISKILSKISFSINKKDYLLIRYKDFYIFENNFLDSKNFRKKIIEILNIKIKLKLKKDNRNNVPYMSDLLMYNYLDQDNSWNGKLFYNNHKRFQMYNSNELTNILLYYLKIETNLKMELESKIKLLKEEREKILGKIEKIEYTKEILDIKEKNDYINFEDFKFEIEILEKEISNMSKEIQDLKLDIFRKKKKIQEIEENIDELSVIYNYFKRDNKKLVKLRCKTCDSSITSEIFLKIYNLKNDFSNIFEIYAKQIKEKQELEKKLNNEIKNLIKFEDKFENLKKLLQKQKNHVSLNEIIVKKGSIENLKKLEIHLNDLYKEKDKKEIKIEDLDKELKEEKKEIKKREKEYAIEYNEILDKLDLLFELNLKEYKNKFKIFSCIKETGSSKNLVYLIQYFIYFKLISKYSIIKFPFIMDTIIKEEIDSNNQKKISRLIEENFFNLDNQLIFGYTEKVNINLKKENYYKIKLKKENMICNKSFRKEEEELIESIMNKLSDRANRNK